MVTETVNLFINPSCWFHYQKIQQYYQCPSQPKKWKENQFHHFSKPMLNCASQIAFRFFILLFVWFVLRVCMFLMIITIIISLKILSRKFFIRLSLSRTFSQFQHIQCKFCLFSLFLFSSFIFLNISITWMGILPPPILKLLVACMTYINHAWGCRS